MEPPPPRAAPGPVAIMRCGTQDGPPPGGDPLAGQHPASADVTAAIANAPSAGTSPPGTSASHGPGSARSGSAHGAQDSGADASPRRKLTRQDTPIWRRFSGPGAPETFEAVLGTAPAPQSGAPDAPPMGPTMAPWALNSGAGAGHSFVAPHSPLGRARSSAAGSAVSAEGTAVPIEPTRAPWAAESGDGGHPGDPLRGYAVGAGHGPRVGVPSDAFSRLTAQQAPVPDFSAGMSWTDVVPPGAAYEAAMKRIDSPQLLSRSAVISVFACRAASAAKYALLQRPAGHNAFSLITFHTAYRVCPSGDVKRS